MFNYRLNTFTEININKPILNRMQLWDVNIIDTTKKINDTEFSSEIEINIDVAQFSLKREFTASWDAEYFNLDWKTFYRNCYSVGDIKWWEIFYSWFYSLPWQYLSNLHCKVVVWDIIKVDIKVSPLYLFESRWRLAKNPSFEEFLSDLICSLAILKWKIPMHSAALDTSKWGVLFMWLPNTWKTTTSMLLENELWWNLISEDITFIDIKTMKILSSPYTSSVNFPKEFISKEKLKYIITLYRDNEKRDYYNFVEWNNLYEFTFLKNLNIKTLFLYWSKKIPWLSEVEKQYLDWIKKIIESTKEISTVGISMNDYRDYLLKKII